MITFREGLELFCFSVMVAGTVMNSTLAKQNEDSSVRTADLFVFTFLFFSYSNA